jgi:hypothetical protein
VPYLVCPALTFVLVLLVGPGGTSGATPTVGQVGGVGKQGGVVGGITEETVDKEGSLLVPTYRGVWVNTLGKYFTKLPGEPLKEDEPQTGIRDFPTADDAALFYDSKAGSMQDPDIELNFKANGTRMMYPDTSSMANASRGLDALGGGASSVVPALSVINLKVSSFTVLSGFFVPLFFIHGALTGTRP